MSRHSTSPSATEPLANEPTRNGVESTCPPYNDAGSPPAPPQYPNPDLAPNKQPPPPQPERWACIPAALRDRPQWALAAPDKRPLTADGRAASSIDPSTWTDFASAFAAAQKRGLHIGYMLHESDPFACIDLDVKDSTPQEHIERFQKIVDAFDSYTERSRSGKGVHVWVEGKIGRGKKRDGVELYSQERFIICTGDVVVDKPVTERRELLETLFAEMSHGSQPEADLNELGDTSEAVYVARQAMDEDGQFRDNEFGKLAAGDWEVRYPSASEADLALVKLLAKHSELDGSVWAAFQMFPLGKRVKDGRVKSERPDYMRRTLATARQHLANDAMQIAQGKAMVNSMSQTNANPRHFRLLFDRDLERLPPQRWLVKRIIPDRGVGCIYGKSGTFKSFLTLDLLAHISNGDPWFGHHITAAPTVYVPFEGQGGIPKRVAAWRMAKSRQAQREVSSSIAFITDPMNLRLPSDRDKLVATLIENGSAGGVLCIDTLAQAGAGIDENSSEGMGEMIAIFQELQHRLGGVVLVVHHSGKVASAGMRGWSGLRGALDFAIECQQPKDAGKFDAQFILDKVKDDESGRAFDFSMLRIHLGYDEGGEEITSLTVMPPILNSQADTVRPAVADRHHAEDEFVWQWISEEVEKGKRPSRRSLEAQRAEMATQMTLTQKQLRDATARLFSQGRVQEEKEKGNPWLRSIDIPQEVKE